MLWKEIVSCVVVPFKLRTTIGPLGHVCRYDMQYQALYADAKQLRLTSSKAERNVD